MKREFFKEASKGRKIRQKENSIREIPATERSPMKTERERMLCFIAIVPSRFAAGVLIKRE